MINAHIGIPSGWETLAEYHWKFSSNVSTKLDELGYDIELADMSAPHSMLALCAFPFPDRALIADAYGTRSHRYNNDAWTYHDWTVCDGF